MTLRVARYAVAPRRDVAVPRMRIAILADLHACAPLVNEARVKRIVDQVQGLEADMICLLGDYVGHSWGMRPLTPPEVVPHLARLTAPLGVHAIMGNHDWKDDPVARRGRAAETFWHRALTAVGLPPLSNVARVLEAGGVPFTLAGLESQRAYGRRIGGADVEAALQGCDPGLFTILLAHEPDAFADLPDHVDLTLSGHTHGGQIRFAGRPWMVPSRFGVRYAYGHLSEGTRQLVVSSGIGTSGPPIRLFCPPELTVAEVG
ncbi:metallophosphoesterase [Palleronia sp.]|uniref:metallophosphoesterase n=1 Tax=Palleronia sp. TaxID=1940284 RepID=UPI0035C83F7B